MPENLRSYKPLVISVSAFLFAVQILAIVRSAPSALQRHTEFEELHTAGSLIRTGQTEEIYRTPRPEEQTTNFTREPPASGRLAYEGLFFVPFSLLGYRAAYLAFSAVNLGLLAFSLHLLLPYFENFQRVWQGMPSAVFFLFLPVALSLVQATDSILLFALVVAAATSFYRERNFLAGVFLGLAIFKFQFAVPIILLFALWRRWRMVAGFVFSATAAVTASIGITGVTATKLYAQHALFWFSPDSLLSQTHEISSGIPNLQCLLVWLLGSYVSFNFLYAIIAAASNRPGSVGWNP